MKQSHSQKHGHPTFQQILKELLDRSGIPLEQKAKLQLEKFHNLLREANEHLNLTRIHNLENIVRKQFIDSLIVFPLLKKNGIPIQSPVIDLGSGPGLPGIPLAIAYPDTQFILVEGRKNRCEFLEHVVRELEINNCTVVARKLVSTDQLGARTTLSRAFSSIPETLERSSGSLQDGGFHVLMKGPNCDEEIELVRQNTRSNILPDLDHHYTLPESRDRRRLIVYRASTELAGCNPASRSARNDEIPSPLQQQILKEITSSDNREYRLFRSLDHGKAIKKHGATIVSGKKIIVDYLQKTPITGARLLLPLRDSDYENQQTQDYLSSLPESIPILAISPELFRDLDFAGTGLPLLYVPVPEIEALDPGEQQIEGPAVALPLTDPENLGAACRSALAFGIKKVFLLTGAANPYHFQSIRASAGAVFQMNFTRLRSDDPDPFAQIHSLSGSVGLHMDAPALSQTTLPSRPVFLVGLEGPGLPHDAGETRVRIDMEPAIESLNASVALSIVLYEWYKQSLHQ